jgi:hypothetical protein
VNYPNPFNPTTFIAYALAEDAYVKLEVFNLLGERVLLLVNEMKEAGHHVVRFEGRELSSGVYVYRLKAGATTFSKRMLLLE